MQEAFTRAAASWPRLRDYDVPEAWVRRVAMNLAADRARTVRRQARAIRRLRPAAEVPGASVEALALAEALRSLPIIRLFCCICGSSAGQWRAEPAEAEHGQADEGGCGAEPERDAGQ